MAFRHILPAVILCTQALAFTASFDGPKEVTAPTSVTVDWAHVKGDLPGIVVNIVQLPGQNVVFSSPAPDDQQSGSFSVPLGEPGQFSIHAVTHNANNELITILTTPPLTVRQGQGPPGDPPGSGGGDSDTSLPFPPTPPSPPTTKQIPPTQSQPPLQDQGPSTDTTARVSPSNTSPPGGKDEHITDLDTGLSTPTSTSGVDPSPSDTPPSGSTTKSKSNKSAIIAGVVLLILLLLVVILVLLILRRRRKLRQQEMGPGAIQVDQVTYTDRRRTLFRSRINSHRFTANLPQETIQATPGYRQSLYSPTSESAGSSSSEVLFTSTVGASTTLRENPFASPVGSIYESSLGEVTPRPSRNSVDAPTRSRSSIGGSSTSMYSSPSPSPLSIPPPLLVHPSSRALPPLPGNISLPISNNQYYSDDPFMDSPTLSATTVIPSLAGGSTKTLSVGATESKHVAANGWRWTMMGNGAEKRASGYEHERYEMPLRHVVGGGVQERESVSSSGLPYD